MPSVLSRLKDAALERALTAWLRPQLQRYGELKGLQLDTANQTVRAEVQLLGEPDSPVRVEAHFRVENGPGGSYAVFSAIRISRVWAQNLVDDRFGEIRVRLPEAARILFS